jgi:hypothetical protein
MRDHGCHRPFVSGLRAYRRRFVPGPPEANVTARRGSREMQAGGVSLVDASLNASWCPPSTYQTQCVSLTIITSPDVVNSMLIIQSRFAA